MLIEATAFGFALAPFALTLATPNTALAGAFAIGLVISIIGLFLSEFAGRALYKNRVVDNIMSYENLRRTGAGGDMMSTHIITIDNTNDDDSCAPYQQMLNRVKVDKDGDMPAKRLHHADRLWRIHHWSGGGRVLGPYRDAQRSRIRLDRQSACSRCSPQMTSRRQTTCRFRMT